MAVPSSVADLFSLPPSEWPMRGDPIVWAEMRSRLADVACPTTGAELSELLCSSFEQVTGRKITYEGDTLIERPDYGGTRDFLVTTGFWRDVVVPMLCARLEASLRGVTS